MKRSIAAVFVIMLVVTGLFGVAGCTEKDTTPAVTVGVSELKGNPDKYLGNVRVTGLAGNVFPTDGVIEIADAKACCAIYLLVPFGDSQKSKLGAVNLYKGEMPQKGQEIEAEGLLQKGANGYSFVVSKVLSNKKVLIERI